MSGPNGEDIGYGLEVHLGNNADPVVFTELALIGNISLPQPTFDEIETTHQKSDGRTRQFIAGLKDPGEAGFECSWVPNSPTDEALAAAFAIGQVFDWQFKFPFDDAGTPSLLVWSFKGWVKAYQPAADLGVARMASTTLRISGSTAITTEVV